MQFLHVFAFLLLLNIGINLITFTEARIDEEHHHYYHHHHIKDQAPTDASFRHRYNAILHSHNPMFGVMSKYFLRNRAQEHEPHDRKRRQTQQSLQQLEQLAKLQQNQQNKRKFIPYNQNVRQVWQPQVYPNGYSSYPRYQQAQPSQQIYFSGRKWNGGPPISQYQSNQFGLYGKPQTLSNYYRNKGDYYRAYNIGKQYSQFNGPPQSFNRLIKRQDNSNQNQNLNLNQNSANSAGRKPIKRKFRPTLVQS